MFPCKSISIGASGRTIPWIRQNQTCSNMKAAHFTQVTATTSLFNFTGFPKESFKVHGTFAWRFTAESNLTNLEEKLKDKLLQDSVKNKSKKNLQILLSFTGICIKQRWPGYHRKQNKKTKSIVEYARFGLFTLVRFFGWLVSWEKLNIGKETDNLH